MVGHLSRGALPLLLCLIILPMPVRADEVVALAVPYRSQLDDSPFARSNCGPASLAMVLGTFGVEVPTDELRDRVNAAQGTWDDVTSGTAIQVMAGIARQYGLQSLDLTAGRALRRWTLEDVRRHVQEGRPVVAQLWYPGLPGRANATYRGDHYIVVVGFEGDEFFYHDPISDVVGGPNRRINSAELTAAWEQGDLPFAGLAFAGPVGQPAAPPRPIRPPTRTPTRAPTPTRTPTPLPTATPTASPSPSPTPTATPTLTPSPSPTPTVSPTPSPTVTVTPSPTSTATPPPTPAPLAIVPDTLGPTTPAVPGDSGGLVALVVTGLLLLGARGLARGPRGAVTTRGADRRAPLAGD